MDGEDRPRQEVLLLLRDATVIRPAEERLRAIGHGLEVHSRLGKVIYIGTGARRDQLHYAVGTFAAHPRKLHVTDSSDTRSDQLGGRQPPGAPGGHTTTREACMPCPATSIPETIRRRAAQPTGRGLAAVTDPAVSAGGELADAMASVAT